MKIQEYRIYLRPLDDHKCPDCGEKVSRRPRTLWQKLFSFALPLRHYKCNGCYHRFFAFSPTWQKMPIPEKILRIFTTAVVLLAVIFISFKILFSVLASIMA
ncbi:MAG: hypothetical protein H5U06_05545 [Candidatus Aminicenantes bacterium]|nr:hypothetical protein [Candidatus Aminicenantes bacterium]